MRFKQKKEKLLAKIRKQQENWGGNNYQRERNVVIMQRQLYLAQWYYHHNPDTILSSTSADAALNALWQTFMGGNPQDNNPAQVQIRRTVRTTLCTLPSLLLLPSSSLSQRLADDFTPRYTNTAGIEFRKSAHTLLRRWKNTTSRSQPPRGPPFITPNSPLALSFMEQRGPAGLRDFWTRITSSSKSCQSVTRRTAESS